MMDHLTRHLEEYEETGDPESLIAALITCRESGQTPPVRLIVEISEVLEPMRHKRPERGRHSPAESQAAYKRDIHRAHAVWRNRRNGVPEREAYQAAADDLSGTEHEGSDEAMRQSWRRVKADLPPTGR